MNNNLHSTQLQAKVFQYYKYLEKAVSAHVYREAMAILVLVAYVEKLNAFDHTRIHKAWLEKKDVLDPKSLHEYLVACNEGNEFYNVSEYTIDYLSEPNARKNQYEFFFDGFSTPIKNLLQGLDLAKVLNELSYKNTCFYFFRICHDLSKEIQDYSGKEIADALCNCFAEYNRLAQTPELYRKLISQLALKIYPGSSDVRIFDPVCGTGNLLYDVCNTFAESNKFRSITSFGQDINLSYTSFAKVVFLLSGYDYTSIEHGNSMQDECFNEELFNLVVADLPLGQSAVLPRNAIVHANRAVDVQSTLLQCIINKIDDPLIPKRENRGYAFVITSEVPLVKGDASSLESNIRKHVILGGLVKYIVALPKIQGYTGVQQYLWVLSNDNRDERHIQLVDCQRLKDYCPNITSEDELIREVVKLYDSDISEKYNMHLSPEELCYYQISLTQGDVSKQVKVPANVKVESHLLTKGFDVSPNGPWNIEYAKTLQGAEIVFAKYFTDAPTPTESQDHIDALEKSIKAASEILKHIKNTELPKSTQKSLPNSQTWYKTLPLGWRTSSLNSCAVFTLGSTPRNSSPIKEEGMLPLLEYSKRDWEDNVKFVRPLRVTVAEVGDIIVVTQNSNVGKVVLNKERGILGPASIMVRSTDLKLDQEYLGFCLIAMESHLKALAKQEHIAKLSRATLGDVDILIPPLSEQKKIVRYLSNLRKKIDSAYSRLGALTTTVEQIFGSKVYEVVTGKYEL